MRALSDTVFAFATANFTVNLPIFAPEAWNCWKRELLGVEQVRGWPGSPDGPLA